jgi:hypothetical protein
VIDLQGIFESLIEFFEAAPNGTRSGFTTAVVNLGIASQAEVDLFLDRFLAIGEWMGYLADDDFAVMMAKRREIGLTKATNGARAIYDRLLDLVDFRLYELQDRLTSHRAALAAIAAKLPLIATARAWIAANAPGTAAMKAATLEALDLGVAKMTSDVEALGRLIAQIEDQIRQLGGEPI